VPLQITYLNSVVMPDEEPETSEDGDLSGSEALESGDDSADVEA